MLSWLKQGLKTISGGDRAVKALLPIVARVNSLEPSFSALSNETLKLKTKEFKQRLEKGETLEELLPEAFAAVREAGKRTLGQRHFDVQLMGGIVLHRRGIAEMRTGEGKTLVATLPVYLNALSGKGVHVITVNDYLARRDAVWMGQIYNALGLSISSIGHDESWIYDPAHTEKDRERDELGSFKVLHEFLRPSTRREAYAVDITYGTNSEFGFDYLRDNIEYEPERLRQRGHPYAVVDEVDSILIDEARTPLIISAPAAESEDLYRTFARVARELKEVEDYIVEEKHRQASLTDAGITKSEKLLGISDIYTEKGVRFVHHLETAVRAKALFRRDKEYVVKDGKVIIVDEFTGRMQPGRRWSEGLHQAVEAKEGVAIERENRTFASVTYQNYFRLYEKLSGMTGTAATSAEEFYKVYGIETVVIPTNRPSARMDRDDFIFQTEKGKFKAIARKVGELHKKGQPVLIGTVSIEKNEMLSAYLKQEGVPHEILNAKNHEREAEIVAQTGKPGAVTIATNMAGRGVDIKLGGVPGTLEFYEEIKKLGGLFVLGTERHEARRIDNQLRGRSGRQGDPGETQFFVSLEDDLMRVFASDTVKSLMGSFGIPEDEPLQSRMVTRSLEAAQGKIEGFNFDRRKHILEYDSVLNHQRMVHYGRRRVILLGKNEEVWELLSGFIKGDLDMERIILEKKESLGEDDFFRALRRLLLQTLDMFWIDHLEAMEYLRESVNLRAYGQRDPLAEYKKEGLKLFKDMEISIPAQIIGLLPHLSGSAFAPERSNSIEGTARDLTKEGAVVGGGRIGRNDTVTITDGKETKVMKWKKAEILVASGWKLVG
ncbi:MAG: preprotein translocase subunit SecA [Patescibacteria group bacterium]